VGHARGRAPRDAMTARRILGAVLVYAAALAVLALFLAPLIWVAGMSFKTRLEIFAWPPTFLPAAPTWQNYAALFAPRSRFPATIASSLIAATIATTVALVLGVTAAYALASRRLRKAEAASFWMLTFRMLPPVALVLPYYFVFRQTGLLGSLWAIGLTHAVFSIAIVIWMMKAYFETLPREIEEAARIDGATTWQVFTRIALPLSHAAVAAAAIFSFLTSWNEFLFAVILSRPQTQTVPVAVASFVGEVYVSWGELAAATVLGLLPALALVFVSQRFLLIGIAPGGVK